MASFAVEKRLLEASSLDLMESSGVLSIKRMLLRMTLLCWLYGS